MNSTCAHCGAPIPAERYNHTSGRPIKWCSKRCANAAHRAVQPHNERGAMADSGKVGAAAELIVAVDLLRQGYEVFRSVSQSCSCDLIALRDGRALRVEVRTATKRDTGLSFSRHGTYDVIAAVAFGDKPVYEPELYMAMGLQEGSSERD